MSEQPSRVITILHHVLRGPHRRAAAHAIRAVRQDKHHTHGLIGEFLGLEVVDETRPKAVALHDVLFDRLVQVTTDDVAGTAADIDVLTEPWWPDVFVVVEPDVSLASESVLVPSEAQRLDETSAGLVSERVRRVRAETDRDLATSHVMTLVAELRAIVQGYVPKGLDKHKELMDLARKAEDDMSEWWIPTED